MVIALKLCRSTHASTGSDAGQPYAGGSSARPHQQVEQAIAPSDYGHRTPDPITQRSGAHPSRHQQVELAGMPVAVAQPVARPLAVAQPVYAQPQPAAAVAVPVAVPTAAAK